MAILTKKYSKDSANDFYQALVSSNALTWAFMSHSTPWTDENSPPTANQSFTNIELSIFEQLIHGKRVANTDVSFMVPRHTWAANTVYAQYDPIDKDLLDKSFFVITSSNNVFKCLFNNNGANSVIEPEITTTDAVFDTSDGYRWKYLFNITTSNMNKFASNNYIPVTPNTAVVSAALPGSIDTIIVSTGGSGYDTYHSGYFQAVVNTYALVIGNTASSSNDFYTNSAIYLKSGMGASQLRSIHAYDGATRTVIVDDPIDLFVNIRLANTSGTFLEGQIVTQNSYAMAVNHIASYIAVGNNVTQTDTGATGKIYAANSTAYIVVRTSPSIAFGLNYPILNDAGSSTVKTGNVTVNTTSTTVVGTGSAFTTDYSAYDYIQVGTQTRLITAVSNNTRLTVSNVFTNAYTSNLHYKVSGAASPTSITTMTANGSVVYSDLNGVELPFDTATSQFQLGELVKQTASAANGVVVFANTTLIRLNEVNGTFIANASIQGSSSNTSANVTSVVTDPNVTVRVLSRAFNMALPCQTDSGNGIITGMYSIPDNTTQYIVSPYVNVNGFATTNASAYCTINSVANSVDKIVMINRGEGYVSANVTLQANALFGSGAVLRALVSPVKGHGGDPIGELGGSYVGISTTFGNASSEGYGLHPYAKYRTVGLIKNPAFNDLYITIESYDRAKLTLSNTSNTFTTSEIVLQSSSNAAGVVVYANSSFLELQNVRGTFTANASGDNIRGLSSNTTANTRVANVTQFVINSNNQTIVQNTSGASAVLYTANSTLLRVTNATGKFIVGQPIFDALTNACANISAVNYSNNSRTQAFSAFKQTIRIGLSSNTGAYANNETIVQSTSGASAVIVSTVDDVDLSLNTVVGSFTNNELITQTSTGATGRVLAGNSSYLKITAANGSFNNSAIVGATSGATANTIKRAALVCCGATGTWSMETNNQITGLTSNAVGFSALSNTISYPDLTRNVGEVLYIENIQPITRSTTSQETVKLVIKF